MGRASKIKIVSETGVVGQWKILERTAAYCGGEYITIALSDGWECCLGVTKGNETCSGRNLACLDGAFTSPEGRTNEQGDNFVPREVFAESRLAIDEIRHIEGW